MTKKHKKELEKQQGKAFKTHKNKWKLKTKSVVSNNWHSSESQLYTETQHNFSMD